MRGRVVAVCISKRRGTGKQNIGSSIFIKGHGLEGDAHAGDWHRQVSLLAIESIKKVRKAGLNVNPGDFGENITTEGIELTSLPVGTRLKIGLEVILGVSQIGKEHPSPCEIDHKFGCSLLPRKGIFAVVLEGGKVEVGDEINVGEGDA